MSALNISSLLQQYFSENWWNNYGYTNDDFSVEGISNLSKDIVITREKIFNELNKSVLIGEYITLDRFIEQLKQLKQAVHNLPVPLPTSENAQEVINSDLNQNFTDALKIAITSYIDFVQWLKIKIRGAESETVLINDELDDLFEEKEYDKITQQNIVFLFANLAIARLDHTLTPSHEDFARLISFSRDLLRSPRYRGNKFAILLQSKCKYLICKWLVRKAQIKGPMYAVINSQEKEFTINDFKEQSFNQWIDYLENHYELIGGWKAHLSQLVTVFRNTQLKDLTLLQLHALIKYYKDVQPNLKQLSNIKTEISHRYEKAKDGTDEYGIFVYGVALNYVAGNEFSLLLEKADIKDNEVAEAYQAVVDIQSQTVVNNFFPQFKYVEFIVKKLRAYPNALNMLQDLEVQRSYISACKVAFESYSKHIEWSRKNYNYVFHLPFEESKVEIENDEIKELYVASSFVLPLYKQGYVDAFEEFKKEIDAIKASIITSENIQSELTKLTAAQQEIERLKSNIENREIKSIETLSIFTTIVTFVFASVVEFKFITTAFQAFLFTICLSTSLSIFVFLIVLLRSNSFITTVRQYFWRILMAFLGISILWFLIVYAPHMKKLIEKPSAGLIKNVEPKAALKNNVKPTITASQRTIDSTRRDTLR